MSTTAAMAATPWIIPLYEFKIPDGTQIGSISVVKEGLLVIVNKKGLIVHWETLEKAKAVADAIPSE